MKDFFKMFGVQLLAYTLITLNYRAVAQASYVWTGATDMLFAAVNWTVIQGIAKSDSKAEMAGYVFGSVAGAQLGILVSTHLKGF